MAMALCYLLYYSIRVKLCFQSFRLFDRFLNLQIDVEKLARYLPLHLIAVILALEANSCRLKYLLSGFQLLHSLTDIASRHPKIEQVAPSYFLIYLCGQLHFFFRFTQLLGSTPADLLVVIFHCLAPPFLSVDQMECLYLSIVLRY